MGLQRLRFSRDTAAYENAVAALALSKMLLAYLDGAPGPRSVGREQVPVDGWDDVVVEMTDGSFEHWQVKRQQNTSFDDTYLADRHAKLMTKGPNKGAAGGLSKLDEALATLAKRVQSGQMSEVPARTFAIVLPSMTVEIKKDLPVTSLRDLCVACHGLASTAASLEARAGADTNAAAICTWLRTWCGFADWGEMFQALSRITIVTRPLENELRSKIDEDLASWFSDGPAAREKLTTLVDAEADPFAPFSPRMVLKVLRPLLRPDKPTWSHFQCGGPGSPWLVSGTHGADLEDAASVVQALWRESGLARSLIVDADWVPTGTSLLPRTLARLALHLPAPAQALLTNAGGWKSGVEHVIGGTLGLSEMHALPTNWADHDTPMKPYDARAVVGSTATTGEADLLGHAMDLATWAQVVAELSERIGEVDASEVREEMHQRWVVWRGTIEADPMNRAKLLADFLFAAAEGNSIDSRLRVGRHTVTILSQGLFLLLIAAVAIGDASATCEQLAPGRDVRTIALTRWCRSVRGARTLARLDDYPTEILRHEVAKIVVLAGVEEPEAALHEQVFADDPGLADNFAAQRGERRLITNTRQLRLLLKEADPERHPLQQIRNYLQRGLTLREELREKNISPSYLEPKND